MHSLLEKLLAAQTANWQLGEPCTIQQLLDHHGVSFSSLSQDDLLDLVCNEIRLRESAGQVATLEEYQLRFPQIRAELATQWQINAFLDSSPQPTADSQKDVVPSEFGRYEIFREVGRGSMGIVYEAYDRQLRRIVALKRLRSEFGRDSVECERFQHEAESIGRLNHPSIVQVYDFGFQNDSPYIVMEFCSGGTLAEQLLEPMVAAEAVDLLIAIASAVGVAHATGIIHRDLKPANVLLFTAEGETTYKVSDFGLAKSLDHSTSATLTGSILGSPAYMPPEQAAGDHKTLGPASDVYALGAILFQCLTSRPPFVGDSIADVLYQVQHNVPLLVRQLNPRTPRPLETIVAKCLSKSPSDRYSNANELRDDLVRFRSGLAIRARPERLDQKLRRLARRHRLAAALISTSIVLLLGLVISSLVYSARLRVALTASEESGKLALLEKAEGLLAKANGQRMSDRPGRRLIAQDVLREAIQIGRDLKQPEAWFGPYRDEAIETMWLSDLCIRQWRSFSKEIQFADFSPSGRLACLVYTDGSLEVREWDTDTVLAEDALPAATYVAFLDEERFIALADDGVSCFRASGDSLQPEWTVDYLPEFMGAYWLDRQRQRLFVLLADKLLLIDLALGKVIREIPSGDFKPWIDIAFHPLEEIYLITSYGSGIVEIRSLDTHQVLFRDEFPNSHGATGGAWNPNGSKFILFDGDAAWVKIYDWDGNRQSASLAQTINSSKNFAAAGGGARVCWAEQNQLLTHNWNLTWAFHNAELDRTTIKTSSINSFTNFSNLPRRFQPASNRIALAGSPLLSSRLAGPLELALGNEQQRLIGQPIDGNHHVAITPGGQFAVCVVEKELWFFDLANGTVIGRFNLGIMQIGSIDLDGQNNLYIATADYSIALQLEFLDNRIVVNSARRIPTPAAGYALSASVDGRTLVAGAWNGYHSARYAGVWVKTPEEPTCRKILHGRSGSFSSIDPLGRHCLVFFGDQVYRISLPNLEVNSLGPCSLAQGIQINSEGSNAIARGKLWRTSDWQTAPFPSDEADDVTASASGFSQDGSQLILTRKDEVSELRRSPDSEPYLQMEGRVLHYDSRHGTILCSQADGLYFRNLREAASQLSQFGLNWEGPEFEERPPSGLQGVELSLELARLQDYTQWMDYLDERALDEASLHPEDGHAQFQAAMVHVERCEYDRAFSLLQRSSEILPNAITPFQWQAYVLAAQQRWPEAIEAATRFIDACNDPEMRLQRAAWYLEVNQPQRAIEEADQIIAQNPNYYFSLRSRAIKLLAYEQLGDAENAQQMQAAISTDRLTDQGYIDKIDPMVTAEISLRHSRLAACYVSQILAPNNPDYASTMAWSKLRQGDYDAALRLCPGDTSKAVEDAPEFARWLALQVICNANLGKLQVASKQMAQLHLLQPTSCTEEWFSQAREVRLLIAEANKVLEQKSVTNRGQRKVP
jgi:tetratricopeptide (TPR) repeat protein/tRNA A-37 threonylcarbamoyl transferase component Bud32